MKKDNSDFSRTVAEFGWRHTDKSDPESPLKPFESFMHKSYDARPFWIGFYSSRQAR